MTYLGRSFSFSSDTERTMSSLIANLGEVLAFVWVLTNITPPQVSCTEPTNKSKTYIHAQPLLHVQHLAEDLP